MLILAFLLFSLEGPLYPAHVFASLVKTDQIPKNRFPKDILA